MPHEATKLVLGRGEVYFDRFLAGTRVGEGERYIGNTSSFRVQRDVTRLDRATSYRGRRITTAPAVLSESHTVEFVTDNIDPENLAMWFGGDTFTPVLTTGQITETITVKRGRFYQLGKSVNTIGVRNTIIASVSIGETVIAPAGNYRADIHRGRIEVLSAAADIDDGDTLTIVFQIRNFENTQVEAKAEPIYGSLRFLAFNERPTGQKHQIDFFFPYVSISARGQVDLKGDEWQQYGFDCVAMNLSPALRQLYVLRSRDQVSQLANEQVLITEFGTLDTFPAWEDELDVAVNEDWPPAVDLEGV